MTSPNHPSTPNLTADYEAHVSGLGKLNDQDARGWGQRARNILHGWPEQFPQTLAHITQALDRGPLKGSAALTPSTWAFIDVWRDIMEHRSRWVGDISEDVYAGILDEVRPPTIEHSCEFLVSIQNSFTAPDLEIENLILMIDSARRWGKTAGTQMFLGEIAEDVMKKAMYIDEYFGLFETLLENSKQNLTVHINEADLPLVVVFAQIIRGRQFNDGETKNHERVLDRLLAWNPEIDTQTSRGDTVLQHLERGYRPTSQTDQHLVELFVSRGASWKGLGDLINSEILDDPAIRKVKRREELGLIAQNCTNNRQPSIKHKTKM